MRASGMAGGRRAAPDRRRPVVGVDRHRRSRTVAALPRRSSGPCCSPLAEQCAQALDRARLYRAEQGIAETLQRSLLPAAAARPRPARPGRPLPARRRGHPGRWRLVRRGRSSTTTGSRSPSATSSGRVRRPRRSWASCAAPCRRRCCRDASPAEALELLDRFAARLPGATGVDGRLPGRRRDRGHRHAGPAPATRRRCWSRRRRGSSSSTAPAPARCWASPAAAPYTEGTAADRAGRHPAALHRRPGRAAGRDARRRAGPARRRRRRHASADPGAARRRCCWRDVLADTDQPDDVARHRRPPAAGTRCSARLPADPAQLAGVRRAVAAWATAAGAARGHHRGPPAGAGRGPRQRGRARLRRRAGRGVRVPAGPAAGRRGRRRVDDFGRWRPAPADPGSAAAG